MKALALLLLLTATARAEPPALVVAVPVFALSSRAIAAEIELPIASRLSLGLAAGVPAGFHGAHQPFGQCLRGGCFEGLGHGLVDRDEIGASLGARFGDREHLLLGLGEDFVAIAPVGLKAVVDDRGAGVDQLPQDGLVAHDLGISRDIGRGRRGG